METMNVLVSCNDRYVMPLTVLLQSLFDNVKEPVTVWFMWSDISEDNKEFLNGFVSGRGSVLSLLPVGESEFKGYPSKKYISRETYFRLLAAELLPESVKRILWLDADMVINGDITGFYNTDMNGMYVAACPHGAVMKPTMAENCRNIGIKHPEQYFNAGVMLCDLDKWRTMDIPGRIGEIVKTPRKMKFPGQDLTNLIFNGEVKTCDWRKYNCMTHSVLKGEEESLKKEAAIIHYAGFAKPWMFYDIPFADVWMDYYRRCPQTGKKPVRTSYHRMRDIYRKQQQGDL